MFYFISTDLNVGISPIYGVGGLHIDDDERKTSVKLNNKLRIKPYKEYRRQVITQVKNSSLAGKSSQFRRHHNCYGGYMQNRPQNQWPNKSQGDYLTSKQKQLKALVLYLTNIWKWFNKKKGYIDIFTCITLMHLSSKWRSVWSWVIYFHILIIMETIW